MNQISNTRNCQNCNLEVIDDLIEADSSDYRRNYINQKNGSLYVCGLCNEQCERRKNISAEIVAKSATDHDHCLIVAGPGSGKTFTFGQVIEKIPAGSSVLVFTLINNLADDLEYELASIENRDIKVNTLHGYCKELLHSTIQLDSLGKDFVYTPALPELLSQDSHFIDKNHTVKDFRNSFANLLKDKAMDFYLNRATYYNAISHIDSIYHVYLFLKINSEKIPAFEVVIVDEYQDFNKLEAEFIASLRSRNRTLLAGDDDQALYGFRDAKTDFIRGLYYDKASGYCKRNLPYCSRCTPTIVRTTKHFTATAQSKGLLRGRIPREFIPYWPEKYVEDGKYPKINVAKCSALETVPKLVEAKVLELTEAERLDGTDKNLPFMVIGPESGFHLEKVRDHLIETLDQNMYAVVGPKEKEDNVKIEEAYELLHQNADSNLGWRMVIHLDPPNDINEVIKSSIEGQPLVDLLLDDYKEKHLTEVNEMFSKIEELSTKDIVTPDCKIKILLTNFLGSKGLAAKHVFVVGLNDGTFPTHPDAIEDEDVCKFLVALTRAKNSCTLVTNKFYDKKIRRSVNKPSIFFSWLPEAELSAYSYRINNSVLVEET